MERLQKFLSRAGVASRRHAEALIVDGRVKVNGKVATVLGTRIDAQKDLILLDNKLVSANSERKYFLFYKPPGVVTTLSDPEGRPTVADYAIEAGGRVFPVGRLDYDAEGALLLTDDGELANKLMHPSHQVPRVYLAKVKGVPDEPSLQKLVDGVRLEDGMAHAVLAHIFEKAERNTWVKIVVTEGRQHLVKRLCAAIGHPVVRLYRPAHAGLSVHGLKPGQLRALSHDEVRRVKAAADGDAQPEPRLTLPARRHGHAAPGFEPEAEPESESVPQSQSTRSEGEGVRRSSKPRTFTRSEGERMGSRNAPASSRQKRGESAPRGEKRSGERKFETRDAKPSGERKRADKFGAAPSRKENKRGERKVHPNERGSRFEPKPKAGFSKPFPGERARGAPKRADGDAPRKDEARSKPSWFSPASTGSDAEQKAKGPRKGLGRGGFQQRKGPKRFSAKGASSPRRAGAFSRKPRGS